MLGLRKPTVYVQVSPTQVSVRDAGSGEAFSVVPDIAFERQGRGRVVEVGARARRHESPGVQVVNPFGHPRTLAGDFTAGELLLKTLLGRLKAGRALLGPAPAVVLHLQGDPAGGFTPIEVRALREMALGAGASEVIVWQGPKLSDQQVLAHQFPKEGKVLA